MKIEVAPWIRDYVTDMDHLYTKLILEKVKNGTLEEGTTTLKDYVQLFDDSVTQNPKINPLVKKKVITVKSRSTKRKSVIDRNKSVVAKGVQTENCTVNRILGKGDPGIGKTTLLKKIGWDWAKNIFTKVDFVFLLFLKIVKPGVSIEKAIADQMPQIRGKDITPQKIKNILDTFGDKCLLLLDGLDEHSLGQNKDVLNILRGQKLSHCNVFVTSRPHTSRKVERHFETIVRVEGFTRKNAASLASKLLHDEKKVQMVLKFESSDYRRDKSMYKSPILLSFMCTLVRAEDVDLLNRKIQTGEIYARMLRCLYKKFTIRKGIEFKFEEFVQSIFLVGKLALETLTSGDPFMKRQDIIKEVGEDAFDYGLLIGHEDFRLIGMKLQISLSLFLIGQFKNFLEFSS